jgi:SAM-dependent methyltransferase
LTTVQTWFVLLRKANPNVLIASQVEKARNNGVKNCFVSDCQDLVFPEEFQSQSKDFDAVFSNATLHWCKRDPAGVLRNVKKCLKSGGRFVAEFGGFANLAGEILKR